MQAVAPESGHVAGFADKGEALAALEQLAQAGQGRRGRIAGAGGGEDVGSRGADLQVVAQWVVAADGDLGDEIDLTGFQQPGCHRGDATTRGALAADFSVQRMAGAHADEGAPQRVVGGCGGVFGWRVLDVRTGAGVGQHTGLAGAERRFLLRPQIAFAADAHLDDAGVGDGLAQAAAGTQAVLHDIGDQRAFSGHGGASNVDTAAVSAAHGEKARNRPGPAWRARADASQRPTAGGHARRRRRPARRCPL